MSYTVASTQGCTSYDLSFLVSPLTRGSDIRPVSLVGYLVHTTNPSSLPTNFRHITLQAERLCTTYIPTTCLQDVCDGGSDVCILIENFLPAE